jgi:hypothetical protein
VGASPPVLTTRALNRALLARQHLLARVALAPARLIEHLVGLQAQVPTSPYFALWSRIEGFDPTTVERLIARKQALRMVVMRGTLHLVTTRDALALRPAVQPVMDRVFRTGSPFAKRLKIDPADVVAAGLELLRERPYGLAELRKALLGRFPGQDAEAMAYAVHYTLPMVQLPPRGFWHKSAAPVCTTLPLFVGRPMAPAMTLPTLVLRYLAAFGPASVMDAQAWSGLNKLADTFAGLGRRVRVFSDEKGRTLYDLPRAPRPAADTPAPVRFLPDYDNAFLGHDDRTRIVNPGQRKTFPEVGPPPGVLLVDGFIEGSWRLARGKTSAELRLLLFRPLKRDERRAVDDEAKRLLAFAAPEAKRRGVKLVRG